MDLNQLYFDHQILLMRAARVPVSASSAAHLCDAAGLAARIGAMQRATGADAEAGWNRLAATDTADLSLCAQETRT